MNKRLLAALGLVATLVLGVVGWVSPAAAQASYQILDANSAKQTVKSFNCSAMICPGAVLMDTTGAQFGTTTNPLYTAPANGATFPISGAVSCSNCSGSGVSVAFAGAIGANGTPGGFKDASSNFQPLLGDVTNGQWVSIKASITLPVSGTFWQTTQPISAASLPLPALAATSTKQSDGSQKTQIVDGSGNVIAATSNALNVNCSNCSGGSGGTSSNFGSSFPAAGTAIGLTNGTNMVAWSAASNFGTTPGAIAVPAVNAAIIGTVPVSLSSTTITGTVAATQSGSWAVTANAGTNLNTSLLALESGGNLATIVTNTGRIPAQGQALAAASLPVVLTALQLTALTPLTSVGLNAGSNAIGSITNTSFAATQATAANLNATVVGTGTFAVQAAQSGTWNIGSITTLPALVAGSAIVGKVGIDQTTPGTTNLVALAANQSVNQTQLNSVALGSPSNYGTSPGAVAVQGVNAFITNSVGVTMNATPSLANGNGVVQTQGGTVLSATNGSYTNVLQANAVLSQTNPLFASVTDGTNKAAVKAASTPSPATDASLSVTINAGSNGLISTGGQTTANSVPTVSNSQYPVNSVTTSPTPVGAVATGTTGSVVATLGATASVTNFLCEFDVSAIGGTAAVGPVVIAGLNGGSRTYQISSSTTGVLLSKSFSPCIPASAANTAITITTTADATATAVDVNASGYRL